MKHFIVYPIDNIIRSALLPIDNLSEEKKKIGYVSRFRTLFLDVKI